jgi:hypothetical protein
MRRRILISVLLATVVGMTATAPASAHRNPPLCTSNSLDLRIDRDRPVVFVGELVTYTIYAANAGAAACDITNASIFIQLPTATGAPSATRTPLTVGAIDLPGNSAERMIGRISTNVNVNDAVSDAVAQASASGTLHDAPVDHAANIVKTLGTTVVRPGIEVDKAANIRNGQAPQDVTYTFSVYNRTNPPLPLDNVTLTDNQCPGVVRAVPNGDTNGDNRLDPAEVWLYTCTMRHGAGVFTNTATACAELFLDAGRSRKVCDEDQETVEFTNPPVAAPPVVPQVAVKPAAIVQPCTLSTPSGLRVRAGQLNTIRARVRNVDAGTTVTITLPGGKKVTAKTNAAGVAVLRVRPTKSGRATIRIAECAEVERLTVRPARRVVAQRNPRVTG